MRHGFFLLFIMAALQLQAASSSIQKTFFWEHEGKRFRYTCTFDKEDFRFYREQPREYYDFSVYVKEDPGHAFVGRLAYKLHQMAKGNGLDDREAVEFLASFVQHLRYESDGKYEYPRYPVETLVEQKGDCEDTAILLAAMLRSLGYKVVLLSPEGHMGVGLSVGGSLPGVGVEFGGDHYYYIETTNTGWGIGDYPDHLSSQIKVYDPGTSTANRSLIINAGAQDVATVEAPEREKPVTTFQSDYTAHKQLLGTDHGAISQDIIVVDGRIERQVTYVNGHAVKTSSQ